MIEILYNEICHKNDNSEKHHIVYKRASLRIRQISYCLVIIAVRGKHRRSILPIGALNLTN